jgi:hypothetical protein
MVHCIYVLTLIVFRCKDLLMLEPVVEATQHSSKSDWPKDKSILIPGIIKWPSKRLGLEELSHQPWPAAVAWLYPF